MIERDIHIEKKDKRTFNIGDLVSTTPFPHIEKQKEMEIGVVIQIKKIKNIKTCILTILFISPTRYISERNSLFIEKLI